MEKSRFEIYENDAAFINYLELRLPDNKRKKMAEVIPMRTKHLVSVIENVLDSNNTNAILRTSEALGIHEAHLVYGNIKYIPQKSVSKGAHLWMDTFMYGEENENNALTCIQHLKNKGYQLIVTDPDAVKSIHDVNIERPVALCFGQESKGISDEFKRHADMIIALPQYGFTDSYNVAVAAGMVMMPIMERLRESSVHWQLSEEEKSIIYKHWILNYFTPVSAHYEHFKKIS